MPKLQNTVLLAIFALLGIAVGEIVDGVNNEHEFVFRGAVNNVSLSIENKAEDTKVSNERTYLRKLTNDGNISFWREYQSIKSLRFIRIVPRSQNESALRKLSLIVGSALARDWIHNLLVHVICLLGFHDHFKKLEASRLVQMHRSYQM